MAQGKRKKGNGGRGDVDGDDCLEICSPFIVLLLSQCVRVSPSQLDVLPAVAAIFDVM